VPVDVDIAVPPGGATVAGRPEHLARVVRNLLENAARYAASAVSVTLRATGGELELVVADDGPGIGAADRNRVFDRFTRLDDARSRDEGGSGLGLPIAREIVEAHGGRISIGDGPGGRVIMRLPAASAPTAAPSRAGIGGEVEDEPGAGGGGLDGDVTPVGHGDVAHDGQREPRAGLPGS
jgi:signal transduction histidine kinase